MRIIWGRKKIESSLGYRGSGRFRASDFRRPDEKWVLAMQASDSNFNICRPRVYLELFP